MPAQIKNLVAIYNSMSALRKECTWKKFSSFQVIRKYFYGPSNGTKIFEEIDSSARVSSKSSPGGHLRKFTGVLLQEFTFSKIHLEGSSKISPWKISTKRSPRVQSQEFIWGDITKSTHGAKFYLGASPKGYSDGIFNSSLQVNSPRDLLGVHQDFTFGTWPRVHPVCMEGLLQEFTSLLQEFKWWISLRIDLEALLS